jgi:hypothetical protein
MQQTILAILIGVPLLVFGLLRKSNLLYVLFIVVYMQGIFSLLGFSMTIVKAIIEIIVWMFFLITLLDKATENRHLPGIMIMVGFTGFYLIALIVSGSLNFDAYSYFRHYVNSFLIFAGTYMYAFTPAKLFRLNRFIFFLFILQIAASVVKYFTIGRSEEHVGTMIITTGSLNTVFPLMAIVFMIYAWIYLGKKRIYLFYIIGFLFMGWVGDKRGIYFYLVLLLGFLFWKRFRDNRRGSFVPVTFIWWSPVILVALIGVFYVGVRITPSLNPDKKVWGRYDGKYLSSYIYVYNVMDKSSGDYRGRFGGTYMVLNEFFTGEGLMIQQKATVKTILTGFGADKYVGDVRERLEKQRDIGIIKARGLIDTGMTQSLLATGILGVVFLLWFYFFYIHRLSQVSRFEELTPYWKVISSGTFLMGIIFILDFFSYSSTFNSINTVYITFFYFTGQLIRPDFLDRFNIEESPDHLL